jgi:hypothetical protein
MRNIGFILILIGAYVLTGCTATSTPATNGTNVAVNANANANANTAAKPAPAAPTAESLIKYDTEATEAYFKGDSKYFETFLSDKYIHAGQAAPNKAGVLAEIAKVKCDVKLSSFTEPKAFRIDDNTYVMTYKGTFDGTCNDGPNGSVQKIDSPMRGTTVLTRNGDTWQAVFHGENKILDPANPPKADAKKADAPKPEAKKEEAPAAKAATSPNTAAVVAAEKAGWVMWMNKDAKGLDSFLAKSAAISNGDGTFNDDRASIVKYWADMPCKDIKNVDVKDAFGTTLGPNTEMITFKGWSDGTCYGTKNGTQPSMSIYVKEGDSWKLAFGFSGPTE